MNDPELIKKYNVPGPRYTSYPTVPFWKNTSLHETEWLRVFEKSITQIAHNEVSVYIHLPFCESLCTFCGCHKRITKNHDVEQPYIQTVLKEWALYKAHFPSDLVIKELHLGGGTPTFFSPQSLIALMNGIFNAPFIFPESCDLSLEAHPGTTSEAHLEALFQFGFRRISFGIQDYDYTVQKAIHRIQSFDEVAFIHGKSREMGFAVNHDLVYGLPKQHLEGFTKTVDLTIQLAPERIALYSYAHVPWVKGVGQRGYDEADLPQDAEKRALYEMALEKLEAAGYLSIGMDHFALPQDSLAIAFKNKMLHRNFMGYTTRVTPIMIGLGMSAISDCSLAFAQNEKTVEAYQERVEKGEIPVFRGHLLNAKEQTIRQHILDLMCHFETIVPPSDEAQVNKENPEEWAQIYTGIKERLKGLEADGLIHWKGNVLQVTALGAPFVRNVCMAFDLDLLQHEQREKLFSKTI
jgi:oxygen-independent coproporphyrinogen III oxidase